MLGHAVSLDTQPRFAFGVGLQMSKDMHPGRAKPKEERFVSLLRAINESQTRVEEFLIHGFVRYLVLVAASLARWTAGGAH
jgi:hypothetical protein